MVRKHTIVYVAEQKVRIRPEATYKYFNNNT